MAPDLTDAEWLHIDGSFDAVVRIIRTGVPEPLEAPIPMPPRGGASLNDEEVIAVARYIISFRR
jgi:hypothetical protein